MQTNDAFSIDVKDKARSVVMKSEATSASRGERDEVELTEKKWFCLQRRDGAARRLSVSPRSVITRIAHPTLPSSLRLMSWFTSAANSRGSSLNTSLQNPEMMMPTAASGSMPRCWK